MGFAGTYDVLVFFFYPPKGNLLYPPIFLHSPSISLPKLKIRRAFKKKKIEKIKKKKRKDFLQFFQLFLSFFSPSPIHSRRTKEKKKNGRKFSFKIGKRERMKREGIRAFKVISDAKKTSFHLSMKQGLFNFYYSKYLISRIKIFTSDGINQICENNVYYSHSLKLAL